MWMMSGTLQSLGTGDLTDESLDSLDIFVCIDLLDTRCLQNTAHLHSCHLPEMHWQYMWSGHIIRHWYGNRPTLPSQFHNTNTRTSWVLAGNWWVSARANEFEPPTWCMSINHYISLQYTTVQVQKIKFAVYMRMWLPTKIRKSMCKKYGQLEIENVTSLKVLVFVTAILKFSILMEMNHVWIYCN